MTGLEPLPAAEVQRLAALALAEDLAFGPDVTTVATIGPQLRGVGQIVARADGVVSGLPIAAAVFAQLPGAGEVRIKALDGQRVRAGEVLLEIDGSVGQILTAERSALNFLTHLSGIATLTAQWVSQVAGTGAQIRDTRKTMPGLRAAQKYAVRCGGGINHRLGLGDQALVKDNHVAAAGGVVPAIVAVRAQFPEVFLEVECDTLAQVEQAVSENVALVLLDNMNLADLRTAVQLCRRAGVRTEASGGLTLELAAQVAHTGVDYLAVGALTHSAPSLDIALDLQM